MSILQQEAFKVHLRPVQLSTVIKEVVEIYQERIKNKKLTLKVKENNKNLVVMADQDEMIEAIGNLISNSISYSERGIISIETKEDNDYGIIEVSDQGRGIDPETLQTIFHKERVLAEAPAPESGTGLGLYLARQLVLLQKGDIEVSSSVGKGTTFSIKLPKKGTKAATMADTDNPLLDKNAKTILIIEDELPFRQIYRDILRLDGFNVIEAEDGEEGLKLVKLHKPDLVLLDIILPKLSGFDVLTTIKKAPELEHIPVIVYSIINNKAEIDRALKLGASDFTVKGQTPAFEVLNKVRKLLTT
jgi:CheY-like chemotaxis protein/two-component sensor histidine kinase